MCRPSTGPVTGRVCCPILCRFYKRDLLESVLIDRVANIEAQAHKAITRIHARRERAVADAGCRARVTGTIATRTLVVARAARSAG